MDTTFSTNGRHGDPVGTEIATPPDDQHGALPERSGQRSDNGTHDGPASAGAPAVPNGTGTRDARGRFAYGNPGRPRRRTGAPSANGAIGGGTVETARPGR
jgi:hypothetical protein